MKAHCLQNLNLLEDRENNFIQLDQSKGKLSAQNLWPIRFFFFYKLKCCTHHVDSSGKQICGFDHLLLLLYLSLQLGRTDLVFGEQDGGRNLRLLLEKWMNIKFCENVHYV